MQTDTLERVCQLSKADINTGDILLFSGRGFTSAIVKLFTRSQWSHIGMVIRLPESEELLVLESAASNESRDKFCDQHLSGVVMVPLQQKLAEYPGSVAIRFRQGAPMTFGQQQRFWRLIKHMHARPYRNFVWAHLLRWLTGIDGRCLCGFFCSQLVAEVYQRMGWLCENESPLDYVPASFARENPPSITASLSHSRWLKRDKGEFQHDLVRDQKHHFNFNEKKVNSVVVQLQKLGYV